MEIWSAATVHYFALGLEQFGMFSGQLDAHP